MTWYVRYVIAQVHYQVGPWAFDEALEQLRDIRGYEGVEDAHLTEVA